MKRIITIIVFVFALIGASSVIAQTSQPAEEPQTYVWSNQKIDINAMFAKAAAWITGAGLVLTGIIVLGKKLTNDLIEWKYGAKKLAAEKQRELEEFQRATAQAVATLIDANKQNPDTPDVSPDVEMRVRAIATGTGDGTSQGQL